MNPKLLFKVFSVVVMTIVPVVGMDGVVRSEGVVQQPMNQSQTINPLIQQLTTGDEETRSDAATALGKIGEPAIPSLIPLLKDSDASVRSSATEALKKLGYQF